MLLSWSPRCVSFCVCAPGHHDLKVALCSVYARASVVFTAEQYCSVRGLRCAVQSTHCSCATRLASALWPCSSLWAPVHEPVPRLLPVRSSYRASAHSLGLLGPLGLSSLKPFAWCESRRGECVSRAPCTQPWDPHHLCHPHRWLRRASWLSGVWSGCSSTLGRPGAQDPTSPWTRHPLQPSRT